MLFLPLFSLFLFLSLSLFFFSSYLSLKSEGDFYRNEKRTYGFPIWSEFNLFVFWCWNPWLVFRNLKVIGGKRPHSVTRNAPEATLDESGEGICLCLLCLQTDSLQIPFYNLKLDALVLLQLKMMSRAVLAASSTLTNRLWKADPECV